MDKREVARFDALMDAMPFDQMSEAQRERGARAMGAAWDADAEVARLDGIHYATSCTHDADDDCPACRLGVRR